MPIHNIEIANIFNKLADLLEIEGENPFRIRAYRNAARVISGISKNVSDLLNEGVDLTQFPGIGKDLAQKIQTIIKTGTLPLLEEIQKHIPSVLSELMQIEGLGPKRVQMLYRKLKIRNTADLKRAIDSKKLQKLPGFGEKMEHKIAESIQRFTTLGYQGLMLADAMKIAEPLIIYLEQIMLKAKERHCFLELNAQPERLDLNDINSKMAKDLGVKIVISTDAHSILQLDYMRFGIYQARRGWLEANNVLNTQSLHKLKKLLMQLR